MGWVACIDAQIMLLTAFETNRRMLQELRATGAFAGIAESDFRTVRKAVEDLIGLEEFYQVEAETVEGQPLAGAGH